MRSSLNKNILFFLVFAFFMSVDLSSYSFMDPSESSEFTKVVSQDFQQVWVEKILDSDEYKLSRKDLVQMLESAVEEDEFKKIELRRNVGDLIWMYFWLLIVFSAAGPGLGYLFMSWIRAAGGNN